MRMISHEIISNWKLLQQSNLAAADTSNSLAYQFNELMADELEYIEAEAAAAAERDPEDK